MTDLAPYYVVRTGPDRFDMRQTRYRSRFLRGTEHPHDLMATGFTADGMREIIGKWFEGKVETSALECADQPTDGRS